MTQHQAAPPRRRGEHVRRAVLAAAAQELNGGGEVSIAAIAARAGVHETSIYRRWGTKEALLLEAAIEITAAAAPEPDTGTLRGDLVQTVTQMDEFLSTAAGIALTRIALSAAASGTVSPLATFWRHRVDAQSLIDRGRQRGELRREIDADVLMRALIGAVHTRGLFGGEAFVGARAEALVDLVLAGAEPPNHSSARAT